MRDHQRCAEALASALQRRMGSAPVVEGMGVHWHVDVEAGWRRCRIHCFLYDDDDPFRRPLDGSIILGPRGNAHQSKVRVGQRPKWTGGAEYKMYFRTNDVTAASCRVRSVEQVLDSVERWLAGTTVPGMYAEFDFVDRELRRRQQIRAAVGVELVALGSALEPVESDSDVGGSEFGELWVYGGDRSCRIEPGATGLEGALLLHRTQLARVAGLDAKELAQTITAWIDHEQSTAAMTTAAGDWDVAYRADLFERGHYARWHWLQVMAAADDPVLTHYAPLLDMITRNDIVSRFFSFTSLDRLCFSRCLLYPFDTDQMPMLAPADSGRFWYADVGGYFSDEQSVPVNVDAAAALRRLEDALRADRGRVHPGNRDDALVDEMNAAFERIGSQLRALKRQDRQWLRVTVTSETGRTRELSSDGRGQVCLLGPDGSHGVAQGVDEAAAALMKLLENGDDALGT